MTTYTYYTYFEYLENVYETRYDHYYESVYWPQYYGTNYTGTYPPSPYEFVHPTMKYINPFFYAFILIIAILSIMISLFVCYKVYILTTKTKRCVLFLTLFSLTAHLAQNCTSAVLYYYMFMAFDPSVSWTVLMIWDLCFCLTRISIYALFIYRIHLVFYAQQTLFPNTTSLCYKRAVFVVSVCIMFVQCTFYVFYVIIFYQHFDFNHPNIMQLWMNIYWAFLALDICFIAALGFLLSKAVLSVIMDLNKNYKVSLAINPELHTLNTTQSTSNPTTNDTGTASQTSIDRTRTNNPESFSFPRNTRDDGSVTRTLNVGSAAKCETRVHRNSHLGSELVHLATKIAVLIIVSMVSSFMYQLLWMLSYELGNFHLLLFSYTWCLDGVTNMICIYLSLSFAKCHYKTLCIDTCKCHRCALRCLTRLPNVDTVQM